MLLADEPTGNLDTARSREIMELLGRFNRDQGITIVMVTHEADMAAYAHRLVHFLDGLHRIRPAGRRGGLMFWNALLLALREIRRNVLRSLLTILGIVIGVAAVITMVTLGEGATAQVTRQIASLGSNLLMLRPGQSLRSRASARARRSSPPTTPRRSRARSVRSRRWRRRRCRQARSCPATATGPPAVNGTDNSYFAVRDWVIEGGREFTDSELRAGKAVCMLGATVRKELFGGRTRSASTSG